MRTAVVIPAMVALAYGLVPNSAGAECPTAAEIERGLLLQGTQRGGTAVVIGVPPRMVDLLHLRDNPLLPELRLVRRYVDAIDWDMQITYRGLMPVFALTHVGAFEVTYDAPIADVFPLSPGSSHAFEASMRPLGVDSGEELPSDLPLKEEDRATIRCVWDVVEKATVTIADCKLETVIVRVTNTLRRRRLVLQPAEEVEDLRLPLSETLPADPDARQEANEDRLVALVYYAPSISAIVGEAQLKDGRLVPDWLASSMRPMTDEELEEFEER